MNPMSRRKALRQLTAGVVGVTALTGRVGDAHARGMGTSTALKGNVHHSVCKWCYKGIALDRLCEEAKRMGIESIDLVGPQGFATLQKRGLICAMVTNPVADGLGGITRAWNRVEHHEPLLEAYALRLRKVAEAGYPNLICFSGNRNGLDDEQGLENCAAGLKRLMPLAEKHQVTVCMELLNSRVNHKDYQCDHTAWGVELCRRIGSERFKLLYDIYHMQIMEGDIIATIQQHHDCIAHYHTGGVPGRREIDATQELNYPAILKAIVETGYAGYVAQEFIPARAPLDSLRQAIQLCDV
jgi:hydroxypyruvate isomerase